MIKAGGYPCKSAELTLPWAGCLEVRVSIEGKTISGSVVIDWRGWQLTGSVDPERSGPFAGEPVSVIVGGLAWCAPIAPRSFTSDRGLTAREIAATIASSIGQTIEIDSTADRPLGKYFATRGESGGAILSRLFGRKAWHVDTDGVTHVGARSTPAIGKSVAVLNYDARDGRVEVYADRPDQVPIGAILPKDVRLTTNRRITKLHAHASGNKERLVVYTEAA
jgi:hypothetical protein